MVDCCYLSSLTSTKNVVRVGTPRWISNMDTVRKLLHIIDEGPRLECKELLAVILV